jgi:hypothetical protein
MNSICKNVQGVGQPGAFSDRAGPGREADLHPRRDCGVSFFFGEAACETTIARGYVRPEMNVIGIGVNWLHKLQAINLSLQQCVISQIAP